MDRPKRPFFSIKTKKTDEKSQDEMRPKKFKDCVDVFEKTTRPQDDQNAGKC